MRSLVGPDHDPLTRSEAPQHPYHPPATEEVPSSRSNLFPPKIPSQSACESQFQIGPQSSNMHADLALIDQANEKRQKLRNEYHDSPLSSPSTKLTPSLSQVYIESYSSCTPSISGPRLSLTTEDAATLSDYEMQLMLLEQQKKKRFMIVRQEQDSQAFPHIRNGSDVVDQFPAATKPQNPLDYQRQLMLLEEQNRKRLVIARHEQDCKAFSRCSYKSKGVQVPTESLVPQEMGDCRDMLGSHEQWRDKDCVKVENELDDLYEASPAPPSNVPGTTSNSNLQKDLENVKEETNIPCTEPPCIRHK
jgi:hypothetical protein